MKKSSRLGQWNGRTRSSRSGEPVLPQLWRRPVLCRLAFVFATALTVTVLAYLPGPTIPYRVGETYPNDIRVRVDFDIVNHPQTDRAQEEALECLTTAEAADPATRQETRQAVPAVREHFVEGMLLVRRGHAVTQRQQLLLQEEHRAFRASLHPVDRINRFVALLLVMSVLAAVDVLYVVRFQPGLAENTPRIAAVCVLIASTMSLGIVLWAPPWSALPIPLTVAAMILTVAYNPQFALLLSFSLALAATVALGNDLADFLVLMGGLATAILLLRNVRTRTRLVEVGIGAGLAYLTMTVATESLSGQTWRLIAGDASRNFTWGALAGFLVTGGLPLVERGFGILTDISLMELADGSHPLLQELIRRAPGTYTHSMSVATLAEPAAEAIGANPLLTRVGSYFHDVGKMLKPHYFIENQAGQNRHDSLEPALSTLVIIGHVKDGIALGKQYKLPRPILDFIQQHHGTTLVEYFYREAIRLQEEAGGSACDMESSFRYPGPKPQSRESGIVMLADAVESSSRALREPNPNSLRKLVHDLLMKRLLDGQLDDSHLTLTELRRIEESLCKSLIAVYHARIRYPDPAERRDAS